MATTARYAHALGVSALVGAAPLAVIWMIFSAVTSAVSGMPELVFGAVLGAVLVYAVSLPVWAVAIAVIGLPIWWAIERFAGGSAIQAIVLGALLAGGAWLAWALWVATSMDNPMAILVALAVGVGGAISGGLAGYMGWRVGGRKSAEPAA